MTNTADRADVLRSWHKNECGVKDGAMCYRTIGGVRWSWWSEDAAVFKKAGVRHRSAPDGEGTFIHPDDDAAAQKAALCALATQKDQADAR